MSNPNANGRCKVVEVPTEKNGFRYMVQTETGRKWYLGWVTAPDDDAVDLGDTGTLVNGIFHPDPK